jgi:hypothetical protein
MYSTDMLYAGGVQGHRANKLLAALEPEDFACLEPHLEIVSLQHSQVLCEAGQPLHYAFFPHNVIISLMAVMHDGRSAEMSDSATDTPLHGSPYGAGSPECRLQRHP